MLVKKLITNWCYLLVRNPLDVSVLIKGCISRKAKTWQCDRYIIHIVWDTTTLYACLTCLFDLNFIYIVNTWMVGHDVCQIFARDIYMFVRLWCWSKHSWSVFLTLNWGEDFENWDTSCLISIMSKGHIHNEFSMFLSCSGSRKIWASPTLSQHRSSIYLNAYLKLDITSVRHNLGSFWINLIS